MFYKQTINNIKVVILSLDGGLLDLNRLRFNYFKRICKTHNFELNTYYNSGDSLYLLPSPATFPCALLHRCH